MELGDTKVKVDLREFSRYYINVGGRTYIDVYCILALFKVSSHAIGHAIKKLLVPGQRGSKGYRQDLIEAIASIQREVELLDETERLHHPPANPTD